MKWEACIPSREFKTKSFGRWPWKQECPREEEAQKNIYFLHVLVKVKVKKGSVRLMENSREEYISLPSLRPFSEDGGLNSPTWIISEIFSLLMHNTKYVNICRSEMNSTRSCTPLEMWMKSLQAKKANAVSVFPCKCSSLQAITKKKGLKAKHMQTQFEGGLALQFGPYKQTYYNSSSWVSHHLISKELRQQLGRCAAAQTRAVVDAWRGACSAPLQAKGIDCSVKLESSGMIILVFSAWSLPKFWF